MKKKQAIPKGARVHLPDRQLYEMSYAEDDLLMRTKYFELWLKAYECWRTHLTGSRLMLRVSC